MTDDFMHKAELRGRVGYLIDSCDNGFARVSRALLVELRDSLAAESDKQEAVAWYLTTASGSIADMTSNELDADAWGERGFIVKKLYAHPITSADEDCQGKMTEREAFELAMSGRKTGNAWVIWQKAWRAAIAANRASEEREKS